MHPKQNTQLPLPFTEPEEVGFMPERLAIIGPAFKNPVVKSKQSNPESPHLPAGEVSTVSAVREITIRDCLRNTTGILSQDSASATRVCPAIPARKSSSGWFTRH